MDQELATNLELLSQSQLIDLKECEIRIILL